MDARPPVRHKRPTAGGYLPNLRPDPRLVERVLHIARLDGRLDAYAVHPEWASDLRRRSAISNARSSASIEGNPLTEAQAREVVRRDDEGRLSRPDMHEREILQYVAFHRGLASARDRPDLTVGEIATTHRLLLGGIVGPMQRPGVLRGPDFPCEVSFGGNEGTPAAAVAAELDALQRWYYGEGLLQPLPIRVAIWVHEFLTIHPFLDGNGRVARALAHRLLSSEGLPNTLLIVLDAQLNEDRVGYYAALDRAREARDLHVWVDFFLRALEAAYLDALGHVERLAGLPRGMTGCERAIAEWVVRTGASELQVGELARRFDYEPITVSMALKRLVEKGIVRHNGLRGPASRYHPSLPPAPRGSHLERALAP